MNYPIFLFFCITCTWGILPNRSPPGSWICHIPGLWGPCPVISSKERFYSRPDKLSRWPQCLWAMLLSICSSPTETDQNGDDKIHSNLDFPQLPGQVPTPSTFWLPNFHIAIISPPPPHSSKVLPLKFPISLCYFLSFIKYSFGLNA